MRERRGGQLAALVPGKTALGQRGEHVGVPGRLDDDGHRPVVLGGGPDHRGAADVDLLHALLRRGAGGDRSLERVQVHHDQLEWLDAELGQLRLVRGVRGVREQARVHLGMQRLDPPVEALGEAGQLGGLGLAFSALWLLMLAVFWPQLNTYYNCMSGANTMTTQQTCHQQFTKSVGGEISVLQNGK